MLRVADPAVDKESRVWAYRNRAAIQAYGTWKSRRNDRGTNGDGVQYLDGRGAKAANVIMPPFLHANWGYVYTTHKSQGSQWPSAMVVIEPSVRVRTTEGRRWLYTALTRAEKECKWTTYP